MVEPSADLLYKAASFLLGFIMSTLEVLKLIAGGLSIGSAAAILLLVNGRIAGISGIYAQFIKADLGAFHWRLAFLLGLVLPAIYLIIQQHPLQFGVGTVSLAVAGLLVGIGTDLGSGCTSGHGVCGIANFSLRSLLATLVFMGVGMVTVFFLRHF